MGTFIHAFLKEIKGKVDFSYLAPDFNVDLDRQICIEATTAMPAEGEPAAYGINVPLPPKDFSEFNRQSTIRICNSFTSKVKTYRKQYKKLEHVKDKPYVIAIASFDRPHSQLAGNRSIITALYGVYFDEAMTIKKQASEIIQFPVSTVIKNNASGVPLGYFTDESYSDVSAVIYSSLATWGKIRALADNPDLKAYFTTFHPKESSLLPAMKQTQKKDYSEHLLDGLQIYHNPHATYPLSKDTFDHERLAQHFMMNEQDMEIISPDDFLLMRMINSVNFGLKPTGA